MRMPTGIAPFIRILNSFSVCQDAGGGEGRTKEKDTTYDLTLGPNIRTFFPALCLSPLVELGLELGDDGEHVVETRWSTVKHFGSHGFVVFAPIVDMFR